MTLRWRLRDGDTLAIVVNLGARGLRAARPSGRVLWASAPSVPQRLETGVLPGFAVAAFLDTPPRGAA